MKDVRVLYGQTLADIAVQELGDAERAMEVAAINGLGITDELIAGQILLVPDFDVSKADKVQLFNNSALAPASMDDAITDDEGIDFWALEMDFIMQ